MSVSYLVLQGLLSVILVCTLQGAMVRAAAEIYGTLFGSPKVCESSQQIKGFSLPRIAAYQLNNTSLFLLS